MSEHVTEKQFNEMGFTHEDYNQLKDRIEELKALVEAFHQVCPEVHPYCFHTVKSDCHICELQRKYEELEVINRNSDRIIEMLERKYEALVDGINNLPRYYIEPTPFTMNRIRWVRDHELRALMEEDDGKL